MTLELTAVVAWIVIGDEAPKADTDKFLTEGDLRPILLKNSIKMEDCFSAKNQTIMNFS